MDKGNNSPCVASTLGEVMKGVQEYHKHVYDTIVSKESATYMLELLYHICYDKCLAATPRLNILETSNHIQLDFILGKLDFSVLWLPQKEYCI